MLSSPSFLAVRADQVTTRQRWIHFLAISLAMVLIVMMTVSLIKVIQIVSQVVNDYCGLI